MKRQKKFQRRLTLNKETIQSLNQKENQQVVGGQSFVGCPMTEKGLPCPCQYPITTPDTMLCPTEPLACYTLECAS